MKKAAKRAANGLMERKLFRKLFRFFSGPKNGCNSISYLALISDSNSSILSLESDEFKDPKSSMPPPPNGDYTNEEKEVSPNQLSHNNNNEISYVSLYAHKSSSEKVIEPMDENAHQHVTANEFLTLNGFQLLAPGESSNEVTALRSTLEELSSKEIMYKSTITSLRKENKQLNKKLEKALEIAALHENDKEVLDKVAEMESKEMEPTHSQALLQVQSIGRCDQ